MDAEAEAFAAVTAPEVLPLAVADDCELSSALNNSDVCLLVLTAMLRITFYLGLVTPEQ